MSRVHTVGVDIETGDPVDICYGFDEIPGFKSGYFFQVYSEDEVWDDPSGEGLVVNEGFTDGITIERLRELASMYSISIDESKL